jgi:DivIVA domain-containing protein
LEKGFMELTVDTLRSAVFAPAWRGYDMANVDEFVNEVAIGVQQLHDRVHTLTVRAERAESRLGGENDETVKRTLVLAQRAADLVVTEAKAIAERIISDAHRDAARIAEEANVAATRRADQAGAEVSEAVAERTRKADEEHERVLLAHSKAAADAQALAKIEQARTAELHAQNLAARDRVRSLLTDHLARIDRLADVAESVGAASSAALVGETPQ